jgi:hypothetical protein
MFLRKDQAGSAPGHTWENAGDVIEVDDELAWQLLAIPGGGFAEVPAPEPAPVVDEPPADEEPEPETDSDEEEAPKRKGGRPRLPRDAEGKIIREVTEADGDDDTE